MKWKVIILLACSFWLFNPDAEAQWNTSGSNIYYDTGRVAIGKANSNSGVLTINTQLLTNLLRLENDAPGLESSLRFRSKTSGGQWLHADISTYADGQFLGFKVPHKNEVGTGYNMVIMSDGNVGIGTTEPTVKLAVNGTTKTKKIIVSEQSAEWPDYVFKGNYQLPDLSELELFVQSYQHLPGIPTSDEVRRHGQNLGAIQTKLLQKIEELTLYLIDQHNQLARQQEEINDLKRLMGQNSKQGTEP